MRLRSLGQADLEKRINESSRSSNRRNKISKLRVTIKRRNLECTEEARTKAEGYRSTEHTLLGINSRLALQYDRGSLQSPWWKQSSQSIQALIHTWNAVPLAKVIRDSNPQQPL